MAVAALHIPVMLDEVMAALDVQPGEMHVDGTFGAGGYSMAMVRAGATVHAFDRDPAAIEDGQAILDEVGGRLTLHLACFSGMGDWVDQADGVTLDIGVSSMQLDQAERGFSFQADGPLDMRMAQSGETAADFLNNADEVDIANIIYRYGEEPKSRRIARAIVAARPLKTTAELARVVRSALGWHAGEKKDPATRTFQAIRIHINQELTELEEGLEAAEQVLKPGGRLAVVTFHSLEDRIVKAFLRERSGAMPSASRHLPATVALRAPSFEAVAKPQKAADDELMRNPRARSATLRFARRTSAQPWKVQAARIKEGGAQ